MRFNCVDKCNNLCRIKKIAVSISGYSLVRWAAATRWMVLRACWNGCSVGMLMTAGGSVFQGLMTLG